MKQILALGLFFVILIMSEFAHAANDQQNSRSDNIGQPNTVSHSGPSAIFAGPKVGWLKIPAQETTSSPVQTAR